MISFSLAYEKVLEHHWHFGTEEVPLHKATGRVLAEVIYADRDFPPFDRATKDGIAIAFEGLQKGNQLCIDGVIAAGTPKYQLKSIDSCLEIMTGAMVPTNADTVIMYEDISILNDVATVHKLPLKGINIHYQGSDTKKGSKILDANCRITSAGVGVLATVGKASVLVKKLPTITLVSTGNELVDVDRVPLPHQIRKSNIHSLFALLGQEHIVPGLRHMPDEKTTLKKGLSEALQHSDVLMLSGGVSKGKFDFIPEVLSELGITKIFHGVMQQPGKPFWFGKHHQTGKLVFSFPGNPVSTFVNYHIYFKDWLYASLELPVPRLSITLKETIKVSGSLTRFFGVKTSLEKAVFWANLIKDNGSGDLTSLVFADGFIRLSPKEDDYMKGDVVPFIPVTNFLK